MHATGIAGGTQAELARRVAAEHVTLQHAALDQRRFARGHAFGIEGGRAQAARQERALVDREPVREQRLARTVDEEAGLAIQRAAGHGPDEVADQGARDFGGEQHRIRARRHLPRGQARHRALGGAATDGRGRFQVLRGQRIAVPAIALHRLATPRDQGAADAVVGAAFATEEPVRIRIHAEAAAAAQRGAVGILDALVQVATRGFAHQREIDRVVGLDGPRMPAVEFAQVGGHEFAIGQAGRVVVLGVARDRTGLLDGGIQAVLAQVGGAGTALALAEIDGDGDAAVARGLDRLDFAHADVDVQARFFRAGHFRLARALRTAALEQALGDVGEAVEPGLAVVRGDGGAVGGSDRVQCFILVFLAGLPRKQYSKCASAAL